MRVQKFYSLNDSGSFIELYFYANNVAIVGTVLSKSCLLIINDFIFIAGHIVI